MTIRRFITGDALRSSWRRVVKLWQPMAGWTLLVWAGVAVILVPLSSAVLGLGIFRGGRLVVGDKELLQWAMTPGGVAYLLLAGSLALTGAVVRYAGLYRIVADDMAGQQASVWRTTLSLAPDVPALFRLCLAAAGSAVVLLAPLLAGLAGTHSLILGEFDINYYLSVRPPQWWAALAAAVSWAGLWALGTGYLVGRLLLTLPAYLDGHRPLGTAVIRAWRGERGQVGRLLGLLVIPVAGWTLAHVLVDGAYLTGGSTAVKLVASTVEPLRALAVAIGLFVAGSLVLDAVLGFFAFSHVATVLTTIYHEGTDLHASVPAGARLRDVPRQVARFLRRGLRPVPLLLFVASVAAVGLVAGGLILSQIPEARPVVIHAHRAGPPPSPENTLSALERSIAIGADYAEIDVQRTRDGTLVVVHDVDFMRVARDPRRVAEVDYADVADLVQFPDDGSPPQERRVATLGDFLERTQGRIGLTIELKYYRPDPLLAEAAVKEIQRRQMQDEVMLVAMSLDAIRQIRRLAPDIRVGYGTLLGLGDLGRLPVDLLTVEQRSVSTALIREARARGVKVYAWTVNRPHRMVDMIERGVDGLITDYPQVAVRVRQELADLHPAERLLLRFREILAPEEVEELEEPEAQLNSGQGAMVDASSSSI